jgi:plastocyanin
VRRNALSSHAAPPAILSKSEGSIMRSLSRPLRLAALGGVLAALAATSIAACAGGSTYGANPYVGNPGGGNGGGHPTNCTTSVAPAGAEVIGVDLSTTSCDDSTFAQVLGYFGGTAAVQSQVIHITRSPSDSIQFENVDSGTPHTASSLGPWTGSYPGGSPSQSATPSPAGTDISAAGFTSGSLNPGQLSNAYVANVPGMYVFGCAYHYPIGMRTVIIVQ